MAYTKYDVRNVSELSYKALTQKTKQYRQAAYARMKKLEAYDPGNAMVAKYRQLLNIDLRGGRAAKQKALIYASRYLNTQTGSKSGEQAYRRKMARSLNIGSEGQIRIPSKDLRKFGEFMEAARALGLDEMFGSDNIAEMAKKSKYDIERSEAFKTAKEQKYEELMAAYKTWKKA